jgi:hypothetical protein
LFESSVDTSKYAYSSKACTIINGCYSNNIFGGSILNPIGERGAQNRIRQNSLKEQLDHI